MVRSSPSSDATRRRSFSRSAAFRTTSATSSARNGFGHVVVCALLHRGDRDVGIAVGGHRDDERAPAGGGVALDHVDAGHRGHPQVAEHEVDVLGGEALEALLAVAGGDGRVSLRAEDASERLSQPRLVIHDQDLHVLSIAAVVAGVGSTPPSGTGR